ncbi:MAG: peptidase S41 [Crocinitomicaceae bacterium]|nr:peptidase S41 [Crocinitomicaceae bacterium]
MKFKQTALLAIILISSGVGHAQHKTQEAMNKFNTMLNIISQVYVDTVNEMQLADAAIVKMLEDLDPHSVYISSKDKQKMNEPLVGNFDGVGIQFNIMKDTILVVSPIAGGPSEKLGIMAGDKIIIIDGDTVAGVGFTNNDVIKNLRGPKGSNVLVGIKRNGVSEILDFDIKRDKIPIYSVDEGYMIDNKTGYVRVNRFARNTVEEFNAQLKTLKKEGLENLILDLRGNSGGYLQTAIDLADQFLENDKLVVYTQGRSFPRSDTKASSRGDFEKGKLIVLIDEGSASASEIVSGAVQDWDRGIIIGRRSFGKGLVQKPFPLPDGSEVRLTISRYYTPSGRSIQRPYGEGTKSYYSDLNKRFTHGELTNADSIDFPDSLKYETRVNKRTVYGGGGIMPDIFVPLDTSERSSYYLNLLRKGIFNMYSLSYLDKERKMLLTLYPDKYAFNKRYEVTSEMLEDFLAFGEKEKVERNDEDLEKSKRQITNLLKAYVARGLYNSGAYVQTLNDIDPTVLKAVEVINSGTFNKLAIQYK